eukprot:6349836-Pyramimonas_sp.AAC.3
MLKWVNRFVVRCIVVPQHVNPLLSTPPVPCVAYTQKAFCSAHAISARATLVRHPSSAGPL